MCTALGRSMGFTRVWWLMVANLDLSKVGGGFLFSADFYLFLFS